MIEQPRGFMELKMKSPQKTSNYKKLGNQLENNEY